MLVLVCFDNGARTLPEVQRAGRFGVNVLAAGQEHLARRFASKEDAKFAEVAAHASTTASPCSTARSPGSAASSSGSCPAATTRSGSAPSTPRSSAPPGIEPLVWFRGALRLARMTALHIVLGVGAGRGQPRGRAAGRLAAGTAASCSRAFWPLLRAGQALVVIEAIDGAVLLLLGEELPRLHLIYGLVPLGVAFIAEQLRLTSAQAMLDARGVSLGARAAAGRRGRTPRSTSSVARWV